MYSQPIFLLLLFFVAGIFIGDYWQIPKFGLAVLLGFSLIFCGLVLVRKLIFQRLRFAFFAFFTLCFGCFLHTITFKNKNETLPDFERTSLFKINKKLNSTDGFWKYEVEILEPSIRAILRLPNTYKPLDFVHVYKSQLYFSAPKKPATDFQFDYKKFLARQEIGYLVYPKGKIEVAPVNHPDFLSKIKQFRLETLQRIDASLLSSHTKDLLKGIILADRTDMHDEVVDDFNKTGLMHFVAISGTHIVILFWMFELVLNRVFRLRNWRLNVVICLVLIWLFAAFIGFGNSVLRACIMTTVYYIYQLLQRYPDLLHSLALAAFIILIGDTQQLFDIGFQLSFIAVLGIYWLYPPLTQYLVIDKNKYGGFITEVLAVTLAAQLATVPIILYYFHQFSWISLVANLFVIPLSNLVIVFSFLMTVFFAVDFILQPILVLYDLVMKALLTMIHWFSEVQGAVSTHIPFNIFELMLIFVIVFYLKFFLETPNFRTVFKMLSLIVCFVFLRLSFQKYHDHLSETVVINDKKGNVILEKNQKKMIVHIPDEDSLNIKKYIVDPYLSSRRIRNFKWKIDQKP